MGLRFRGTGRKRIEGKGDIKVGIRKEWNRGGEKIYV